MKITIRTHFKHLNPDRFDQWTDWVSFKESLRLVVKLSAIDPRQPKVNKNKIDSRRIKDKNNDKNTMIVSSS